MVSTLSALMMLKGMCGTYSAFSMLTILVLAALEEPLSPKTSLPDPSARLSKHMENEFCIMLAFANALGTEMFSIHSPMRPSGRVEPSLIPDPDWFIPHLHHPDQPISKIDGVGFGSCTNKTWNPYNICIQNSYNT